MKPEVRSPRRRPKLELLIFELIHKITIKLQAYTYLFGVHLSYLTLCYSILHHCTLPYPMLT